MYSKRKRIVFESRLEYKFYSVYKMLPFDMIEVMLANGFSHDYAFKTVKLIMDNIWQHEKELEAECVRRDMALLEYNPFTDSRHAPT